jgi:hypothetical protein
VFVDKVLKYMGQEAAKEKVPFKTALSEMTDPTSTW